MQRQFSFRRTTTRSTTLAAGLTAVLAFACTQAASASTIHACVKPRSGATRIVSAKAKCHHGEKKLAWATAGPAGPKGASGSSGATGAEGKAGANGSATDFATEDTEIQEVTTGKSTTLLSKVIPPGSYSVFAKTSLGAKNKAQELTATLCEIADTPGTAGTAEMTMLDLSGWEVPLGEKEANDFVAAAPLPLEGTLVSAVTSTLDLVCANVGEKAPAVLASFSQLQAITMTRIG